ncbi:flagellar filament capping protein FliD, partial [Porticoccus sp.]
ITGTAVTAAATASTPAGAYQVEVSSLAKAYSIATTGIADQTVELGAGTISINIGSGQQTAVEIVDGASSLQDIRDAINASEAGVSASIVNDGSDTPYRLVLTAAATGTEAAITSLDFAGLASSLVTDPITEIAAANAALTVNGIAITSQTNKVQGAIQGATLSLVEEGSAKVVFERDTKAISDAVEGFVSAYNKLNDSITSLTRYDAESGESGDLLGDSTLRSIQGQMRAVLSAGVDGGAFNRLTDIGITRELGGALKLDTEALDDIIATQEQALTDFFAGVADGPAGLADNLVERLDQVLASNGVLESASKALDGGVKRMDERYARVEQSIDATIARYRAQFSKLDSTIATMNSTSGYLAQQFEIMNAQLNG